MYIFYLMLKTVKNYNQLFCTHIIFNNAKQANDNCGHTHRVHPFHRPQPLDGAVSLRMAAWLWALLCPCSLMTESNIDLKMFQINIFHYLSSRRTQQRNIAFIKVHCVLLCGERGRLNTETQVTAISTDCCTVLFSFTVVLVLLKWCVVLCCWSVEFLKPVSGFVLNRSSFYQPLFMKLDEKITEKCINSL